MFIFVHLGVRFRTPKYGFEISKKRGFDLALMNKLYAAEQ
jgi:hypothetical protein